MTQKDKNYINVRTADIITSMLKSMPAMAMPSQVTSEGIDKTQINRCNNCDRLPIVEDHTGDVKLRCLCTTSVIVATTRAEAVRLWNAANPIRGLMAGVDE